MTRTPAARAVVRGLRAAVLVPLATALVARIRGAPMGVVGTPLALRPPPLAIPSFAIAMRWHLRLDRDPGLAWLRAQLHAVVPT